MADSIPSPSHNVHTTLNYYIPLGPDPPFHYVDKPPPGKPEHNIGLEAKPVVIHDARGHESEFTLDKNGFQFMKHVSQYLDFDDKEKIQSVYYKEVEELVKRELGARKVFVFDHTLRLETLVPRVTQRANERNIADATSSSSTVRATYTAAQSNASTSTKLTRPASNAYTVIFQRMRPACSLTACASLTSGVPSGTQSTTDLWQSRIGANSTRRRIWSPSGIFSLIARAARSR